MQDYTFNLLIYRGKECEIDKKATERQKFYLNSLIIRHKWDKVFKNGPSKTCGRQPLKNLKEYGPLKQTIPLQIFKGCLPQISLGPFLNTLTRMEV